MYREKSLKENKICKRKVVAFVPIRGGSKSIPRKNIRPFCGQPLVYWVLKAANECKRIDALYVSTDDIEFKRVVERMGFSKVLVVERGKETATDEATTESAMIEFAKQNDFDDIVLIQATSPFLERNDLEAGIHKYFKEKADSLLSVVRQKRFIWEKTDSFGRPLNYNPANRPRRQDWEGFFVENGAFYITSRERLLGSNCRVSGRISLYEMDESTYIEIDEENDWLIAEQIMRKRDTNYFYKKINFNEINLLICDVDGVLTDAGMYYSSSGNEIKKFNTRDGKGIELIREAGIKVMFLTSENIGLVKKRADKLNIDYIFMGVEDKKSFLKEFFDKNREHSFKQTAYIGDDLNDLECLKASMFSATPNDGIKKVKDTVKYVCSLKGGQGCVREVCELILSRRNND